jgi:hypothetical protein
MSAHTPTTLPYLLAALLLAPAAAWAEGAPVGLPSGEAEGRPVVVADGAGGAVVSYKTTSLRVGAVHLSAAGVADGGIGFAPEFLPLGLEANGTPRISVPSDSQLLFVSDRSDAIQPVLTSLRDGGTPSEGFPIGLPFPLTRPAVVPGLGGRTVLVAKGSDAVSFWTLRAAIVSAAGAVEFAVQLSSALQFFNSDPIAAASDGVGGAIAVMSYYDALATGSKNIAVFRIAADGTRPWGDSVRPLVLTAGDQVEPQVVPDTHGGAVLVWTDPRSSSRSSDIYALRIDANGERVSGWPYHGTPLCLMPGAQTQPRVIPDGSGGAWVVWLDQLQGGDHDLRYTHVLDNGLLAPGFSTDGAPLCVATGLQNDAQLAGDGAGGFFAVWRDERAGNADVYAQHVLANGELSPGWVENGRAISTAPGAQDQPAIAATAGGHAVIAWRDARDGTPRVYAAALLDPITTDAPTPEGAALALTTLGASRDDVLLSVSLPAPAAAVLDLLDVAGRTHARITVAGPAKRRTVRLATSGTLVPGIYFARLRQGDRHAVARVMVLR